MVLIDISDGALKGQVLEDDIAGKYYSFKGIPYAAPPLGDLRFKAPQPVKPWTGVKSALEYGSPCFQNDHVTKKIVGSEDCLYLNVFTPEVTPKKPLPVMVWIHGGGFLFGSGNDDWYGPEFLVRKGVILVTFNYRLGVLGFLCLDSEDVPGNAGMKDQVAALRWVRKNISQFGGDPENVTIFGESAGGASVTYHLISPMSKGLFKRAIAQSGSPTCWWGNSFAPSESALALARRLNFYSEDKKELYEFFKEQPIEKLNPHIPITAAQLSKQLILASFAIAEEKDYGSNERFVIGHPYDVSRYGIHEGVEVITGYNADEGLFGFAFDPDVNSLLENINYIGDYLTPEHFVQHCSATERLEVGRRLKEYYFGQKKVTSDDLEQIVKYFSMKNFTYESIQWAKIASTHAKKNKVFQYKFTCKSERNIMGTALSVQHYIGDKTMVCHCDDIPYLFPIKSSGLKTDKEAESFKMIENVTSLWTNFAKYGNPTPDDSLSVKWVPYDVQGEKYLDLGNQLEIRSHPDAEEIKLWEDCYREFCPKYVH